MERNNFSKAILAAVAVYTLWGFSFMASKVAQETTTPFVFLAYRFDLAALIMALPALLGRKKLVLKGKKLLPLLLLGFFEPCLYFIGEQYGVRFTSSAFSGVMVSVIPIVTLIFAAVFLKDRPSKAQWGFSLLSIAGIIVITLSENSGGEVTLVGVLCLVLAVITGSAYGVISRRCSEDFSVYERSFVMMLMGAVFYTVLAIAENLSAPSALITPLQSSGFILSALYVAIGASVLGYTLFNYAVSNAPMANVVSLCNLTTVISVVAGMVLLKESFSTASVIAMAVVLIGIWGVQKYTPEQ